MARRQHLELVRATGRLADPTGLPFDANHLEDVSILDAALDDLLGRTPHLASRRPSGDIGQGATTTPADSVDLAGILRSRAGQWVGQTWTCGATRVMRYKRSTRLKMTALRLTSG